MDWRFAYNKVKIGDKKGVSRDSDDRKEEREAGGKQDLT